MKKTMLVKWATKGYRMWRAGVGANIMFFLCVHVSMCPAYVFTTVYCCHSSVLTCIMLNRTNAQLNTVNAAFSDSHLGPMQQLLHFSLELYAHADVSILPHVTVMKYWFCTIPLYFSLFRCLKKAWTKTNFTTKVASNGIRQMVTLPVAGPYYITLHEVSLVSLLSLTSHMSVVSRALELYT